MHDLWQFEESSSCIIIAEILVYIGLILLGYAIPTSHSNAFETVGVISILLGYVLLKWFKKDFTIKSNPLYVPLGLLFAAIFLSLLSSYRLEYSLNEIRGEFLTYTLLFFALSGFCQKRQRLSRVLILLCLGNVVALMLFFYQFSTVHFSQGAFVSSLGSKQLFSNGLTESSSYFLMFAAFYYASLFFINDRRLLIFFGVFLSLNLYLLYLSNERAGVVAMVVVFFLPLLFWNKINRNKIYIMSGLLVALVFLVFLTPIRDKFQFKSFQPVLTGDFSHLNEGDAVHVRFLMYEHFWHSFKKHPFVGYGYGRSSLKKVDTESEVARPQGLTHGHNSFFNFMLQTGVQGLGALLFVIAVQFSICLKGFALAKEGQERFLFAGCLFLLVGFWTRMIFDDVYDSGIALLYWVFMAMIVGLFQKIKAEQY